MCMNTPQTSDNLARAALRFLLEGNRADLLAALSAFEKPSEDPGAMAVSELFEISSHVSVYEEHDPVRAYIGVVVAIHDDAHELTIRHYNGAEIRLPASPLVEVANPELELTAHGKPPVNDFAGLPTDPEVFDTHHSLVFLQREHDKARAQVDAVVEELSSLLRLPASWTFLMPALRSIIGKRE